MFALCLVLSMLGCSCLPRRQTPAMTLEDVVRLSREEVLPEEIIARLEETGTVYALKADEVVRLKEQGVDSDVLDSMSEAFVESERCKTRWKDVAIAAIGLGITCLLCHADKTDQHVRSKNEDAGCRI